MFGSFARFASEDAAGGDNFRTKIEKGREFPKDFLLALKTLASSERKKSCDFVRAQLRPKSV
jgi:hypothetical protein